MYTEPSFFILIIIFIFLEVAYFKTRKKGNEKINLLLSIILFPYIWFLTPNFVMIIFGVNTFGNQGDEFWKTELFTTILLTTPIWLFWIKKLKYWIENYNHVNRKQVCPFCSENIKLSATVCKHCGRDIKLNN